MLHKTTFASSALPGQLTDTQRFALWRDIHNSEIASFDYGILDGQPFRARLDATAIGKVVIGTMAGTVNKAERTAGNIAEDGGDGYCLVINTGPVAMAGAQRGREFRIAAGDAVLVSNSLPVKMSSTGETMWTSVIMPGSTLDHGFAGIGDRLGLSISAGTEALGMLARYRQFIDGVEAGASPPMLNHIADTVLDLVALASGLKGKAKDLGHVRGLRAARLAAILQGIEARFTDPAFSAQHLARQLGLSPRYVNELLHDTGRSLTERVLELRLQLALKMLSAEAHRGTRISDIAYQAGFSDISYFNRSFRQRFGCTPKGAR